MRFSSASARCRAWRLFRTWRLDSCHGPFPCPAVARGLSGGALRVPMTSGGGCTGKASADLSIFPLAQARVRPPLRTTTFSSSTARSQTGAVLALRHGGLGMGLAGQVIGGTPALWIGFGPGLGLRIVRPRLGAGRSNQCSVDSASSALSAVSTLSAGESGISHPVFSVQ